MTRDEVLTVMRDRAVDMLEVDADDVREERSFVDDLHVDSLSLVEYTMDLEDTLGVELPEDELTDLKTIGMFLDLIMTKLDTASNSDGVVPATPGPVEAARALADGLLRPDAERVDAEGVPRPHLDALAAAGLFGVTAPVAVGGLGQPAAVAREVAEVLAGACGSTWFVWTQHAMPLATLLASGNAGLRDRHARDLATGRSVAGVAFAHLRRPGRPAVTATRTDGGWRFDGAVDWTTGWGLDDLLLLGGLSPDGEVVLALVPMAEAPGLVATPLRLAVMQGTHTVSLALSGFRVTDADVAQVVPAGPWLEADRVKTANGSPHTFGLQREVVARLAATAERRGDRTAARLAERLGEEGERLRSEAYALIDEVPATERVQERLELRAASLDLVVRSATALVTATGGSAISASSPAQRLAREALFHLVQAQTAAVREATLQRLDDRVASGVA